MKKLLLMLLIANAASLAAMNTQGASSTIDADGDIDMEIAAAPAPNPAGLAAGASRRSKCSAETVFERSALGIAAYLPLRERKNILPLAGANADALKQEIEKAEAIEIFRTGEKKSLFNALCCRGTVPTQAYFYKSGEDLPASIVILLLEKGADPDYRHGSMTALTKAIDYDRLDLVLILLPRMKREIINLICEGQTLSALARAALGSSPAIVKALLPYIDRATLKHIDAAQCSVLQRAIQSKNEEIVAAVLEAFGDEMDAIINTPVDTITPLQEAASYDQPAIVELLLMHSTFATINAINKYGCSVLHHALSSNQMVVIVGMVLPHLLTEVINRASDDGFTARALAQIRANTVEYKNTGPTAWDEPYKKVDEHLLRAYAEVVELIDAELARRAAGEADHK